MVAEDAIRQQGLGKCYESCSCTADWSPSMAWISASLPDNGFSSLAGLVYNGESWSLGTSGKRKPPKTRIPLRCIRATSSLGLRWVLLIPLCVPILNPDITFQMLPEVIREIVLGARHSIFINHQPWCSFQHLQGFQELDDGILILRNLTPGKAPSRMMPHPQRSAWTAPIREWTATPRLRRISLHLGC